MSSSTVSSQFMEFLLTLGWPVNVDQHSGWTGHTNTSWKLRNNSGSNCKLGDLWKKDDYADEFGEPQSIVNDHGGSIYDGHSRILYWADGFSEIAFVVPTPNRVPNIPTAPGTVINYLLRKTNIGISKFNSSNRKLV